MNNNPIISVIIPIYKTEKFIKRCLYSLFEQTLKNVEYILINDCTPDKSIVIAKKIIKSYPDRDIILLENEINIGLAGVRNIGIKIAKGKYIYNADATKKCCFCGVVKCVGRWIFVLFVSKKAN